MAVTWHDPASGTHGTTVAATDYDPDVTGVLTTGGTAPYQTSGGDFGTDPHLLETGTGSGAIYRWLDFTASSAAAVALEFSLKALPSAEAGILCLGIGSARTMYASITIAGALRVRDGSGSARWTSSPLATSSSAFGLDTKYHVSLYAQQHSSTGAFRVTLHNLTTGALVADTALQSPYNTGASGYNRAVWGAKISSNTTTITIETKGFAIDPAATGPIPPRSAASYTPNPADTLGMTDSVTTLLTRAVTIADALGITDTAADQTIVFDTPVGDPLGLSDAVSTTLTLTRAPAEALGITDTASAELARSRTVSDTLGLSDSVTVELIRAVTVSDTLGGTDVVSTATTYDRTVSDTLAGTDAIAKAATYDRAIADPLALTDSASAGLSSAGAVTQGDNLGLSDTVATALARDRTAADQLTVTDSVTVSVIRTVTIADGLGITDQATGSNPAASSLAYLGDIPVSLRLGDTAITLA